MNPTQADEAKDVISRDLYDELYDIKEGHKKLSDEALALVDKTRTQLADAQAQLAECRNAIHYAIGMLDELDMFGGTPSDYLKIKIRLKATRQPTQDKGANDELHL